MKNNQDNPFQAIIPGFQQSINQQLNNQNEKKKKRTIQSQTSTLNYYPEQNPFYDEEVSNKLHLTQQIIEENKAPIINQVAKILINQEKKELQKIQKINAQNSQLQSSMNQNVNDLTYQEQLQQNKVQIWEQQFQQLLTQSQNLNQLLNQVPIQNYQLNIDDYPPDYSYQYSLNQQAQAYADLEDNHPNLLTSNFSDSNQSKSQLKVYVTNPKLYTQDYFYSANRKIRYWIIKTNQELKTKANQVPCFRNGCQGVIFRNEENWWGICNNEYCQAIDYFFIPQDYQEHFINNDSNARFNVIGGFGSGKTTGSAAKIFRLMIEIPNAHGLAFAQTLPQALGVGKVEFDKFVPSILIKRQTKNSVELTNGSWILFLPSNKADRIKGYNLAFGWVIEYNLVKSDLIDQLEKRIRQNVADVIALDENQQPVYEVDRFGVPRIKVIKRYQFIICETNPDPSSITVQWLTQKTDYFVATQNVVDPTIYQDYLRPKLPTELETWTYSSTGIDNPYLSESQVEAMVALTGDTYERMVRVNMTLKEGLVLDKSPIGIIPRIPIPIDWPRVYGCDFGAGHGPTTFASLALDISNPEQVKIYIYDIYKKVDSSIVSHVPAMKKAIYGQENQRTPNWEVLAIIGDPAGKQVQVGAVKSIFDQYANYGIPFTPGYNRKFNSFSANKQEEMIGGYTIMNNLFANHQLFIFDDLHDAISEFLNLRYAVGETRMLDGATFTEKLEKGSRKDVTDGIRYAVCWIQFNVIDKQSFFSQRLSQQYQSLFGHSQSMNFNNGRLEINVSGAKIRTVDDLNRGTGVAKVVTRQKSRW